MVSSHNTCVCVWLFLQRSVGGVVQRRLEDLDATLKRLEEDKSNLKQENASLVNPNRTLRTL